MSEPARPGWRNWYHCTVGTYAKWLPGDKRGWRERNHHEHVAGDYKHPPIDTPFAQARRAYAKEILRFAPHVFLPSQRQKIGTLLLESFTHQQIPVLALAVSATNVHALVQCPDQKPKHTMGMAKEHVTFGAARVIDPVNKTREKFWEKGSAAKPICDRAHAIRVFRYILAHKKEGAWVWNFRDQTPSDAPLARAAGGGGRGASSRGELRHA
jgi:hypothetical protein